jgi:hypothetical protein
LAGTPRLLFLDEPRTQFLWFISFRGPGYKISVPPLNSKSVIFRNL